MPRSRTIPDFTYVLSAINLNAVARYRDSAAPKVASIVLAAIRVWHTDTSKQIPPRH
jgi:hypothetical protein